MTTAELLAVALGLMAKVAQLIRDIVEHSPDLDIAETQAALYRVESDLDGYKDSWRMLRDI